MTEPRPLVWLNLVGMTPRLLEHAPRLRALAERGSHGALEGVVPAVTCAAQASALTGQSPQEHGVVGNGWLHRDTGEIRFWLQSNALIEGDTVYAAARRMAEEREIPFTTAKLFWWFNQGAPVDLYVTPKPWYGSDGSKVFGIQGQPRAVISALESELGAFPFFSFWGPKAGLPSTDWIARAAATVMRRTKPTFTLVYLPHLDYDLQRFGPDAEGTAERVRELDEAAGQVLDAAAETGAEVIAFSEYGINAVTRPVRPNVVLRNAGLLTVRDGPFGEGLDAYESRAFAVCDHQIAHVHVRADADRTRVRDLLAPLEGVARVLEGEARRAVGLDHPRAGDLVLLAERDAWFAYPFWLDDAKAPDYARTVDIHRKPGYDPCELFVDPGITFPALRVARRLLRKVLGFRYRMDVTPLDPTLVKGSHGVPPADPQDGPILVASDPGAASRVKALTDLKAYSLERMLG